MKQIAQIETFRDISGYQIRQLVHDEPSCFNGIVSIKRYRITVEEIEEPAEVLQARVQALWDECDNHHNWQPLKSVAAGLGYELKGKFGSAKRKKESK